MANESQEQINQRLTQGVDANTRAIALLAEGTATRYKGHVQSISDLPPEGQRYIGDLYGVIDTGHGYFWNGTQWQDGGVITKGQDGVSPSILVTQITGGHRVTIFDAQHPSPTGQSFDVMDGAAINLDDVPTSGSANAAKSGGIYTAIETAKEAAKSASTPIAHATAADAHSTLFGDKANASDLTAHTESSSAHSYLFAQKANASELNSHKTDSNAHRSLFEAKANASDLTAHTGTANIHVPIEIVTVMPATPTAGTIYFVTGS